MELLHLTAMLLFFSAGICFWVSFATHSDRTRDLGAQINVAGMMLMLLHFFLEWLSSRV